MSSRVSPFDKVRLLILNALNQRNSVKPNSLQVKKITGMHLATIKSSIDFLEKGGVIKGFGPKVDFGGIGLRVEAATLLQADLFKKSLFDEFLELTARDNHTYWLSGVLGLSNFNLVQKQFFNEIENYQEVLQKHYIEKMSDYFSFIKDRQVFFTVSPTYKNVSRTDCAIKLIQNIKYSDEQKPRHKK